MNTKSIASSLVATLFFLCGCASLKQAPLVYSSTAVYGLNVASTSTETPGLSMALGVKLVDAAYVPVAVGYCEENNTHCQIQVLNSTHSYEEQDDGAIQLAKQEVEKANKAQASLQEKQDIVAQEAAKKVDLESRKASIEKEIATLSGRCTASSDDNEVSTEVSPAEGCERLAQLNMDKGTLETSIKAQNGKVEEAQKLRDQQQKDTEKILKETANARQIMDAAKRNDAFSVFGSFDSATTTTVGGQTKGIENDLKIGKVFSTGMASQNLSAGVQNQLRSASLSRCFDSVERIAQAETDNATKATLRSEGFSACKATALETRR